MPHNPEAVQQWAAQILKSPYWEEVKERVRKELTEKLIKAAHEGDNEDIKACSYSLRVLDEVVKALGATSIDFHPKRHLHEYAHESEELENAK